MAGVAGVVEEIQIFNKQLVNPKNKTVIVPNAQVTNDTIKNYSANDTRRVDIVTGIGYDDNIGQARDTLMDIMTSPLMGMLAAPMEARTAVNTIIPCWASPRSKPYTSVPGATLMKPVTG